MGVKVGKETKNFKMHIVLGRVYSGKVSEEQPSRFLGPERHIVGVVPRKSPFETSGRPNKGLINTYVVDRDTGRETKTVPPWTVSPSLGHSLHKCRVHETQGTVSWIPPVLRLY